MSLIFLLIAAILFALILLQGWIQFHALSQQGRMLLRIEALEEGQAVADDTEEEQIPESSTDEPTDVTVGSVAPLLFPLTVTNRVANSAFPTLSASTELATTQSAPTSGNIELTIGMAVYNDFDGVYFTLQALRLYQDLENTELLVIDNYGCDETKQLVERWMEGARYIRATDVTGTAAPRDL